MEDKYKLDYRCKIYPNCNNKNGYACIFGNCRKKYVDVIRNQKCNIPLKDIKLTKVK